MCNICVICNNVHCSWWCRSWWWSAVKESRQPSALQNNWGAWGTPKRIIPLLFFICSSLCESDVISRLLSAMRSSIELGKETSVWIHHSRRKAGGRRDENGWRLFVVNARSADRLQNMLKTHTLRINLLLCQNIDEIRPGISPTPLVHGYTISYRIHRKGPLVPTSRLSLANCK